MFTELTSFPGIRYDDQVDSATQALDHLRLKNSMYNFSRSLWRVAPIQAGFLIGGYNQKSAGRPLSS